MVWNGSGPQCGLECLEASVWFGMARGLSVVWNGSGPQCGLELDTVPFPFGPLPLAPCCMHTRVQGLYPAPIVYVLSVLLVVDETICCCLVYCV